MVSCARSASATVAQQLQSQALTILCCSLSISLSSDVGWLKTVDQYFIGSNTSLQEASVHDLITATMAALKRVPERKFVYVEQAFFQRWWRQQDDAMQALVRSFVASGQLEFINGGWCMHDEATAHYVDMVDQTTLGHQYILKEFGADANPTIGWQVDPFGHSATQAALLSAEVGFDALFFGRIDYQDHDHRVATKEMQVSHSGVSRLGLPQHLQCLTPVFPLALCLQFQWAPSPSLGMDASVWTEVALDGNCQQRLRSSSASAPSPSMTDRSVLSDAAVRQPSRHVLLGPAVRQRGLQRADPGQGRPRGQERGQASGRLHTRGPRHRRHQEGRPGHHARQSTRTQPHALHAAATSAQSLPVCTQMQWNVRAHAVSRTQCPQQQRAAHSLPGCTQMGSDFNYNSAERYFISQQRAAQ